MKVYVLTIMKETYDQPVRLITTVYADPAKAAEAAWYEQSFEEHEIATDTPYRWWAICDLAGSSDRITIELDTQEVL